MKVKLKSIEEIKKLSRQKKIEIHSVSDSGEVYAVGTVGNPSHILRLWYDDLGKEYLVVDHQNPISKAAYDKRKIFFDEVDDINK